ncbi:MAG TPA: porin family protein, partial [Aestuariivirga sp.]|nr:porin family protein [Aestuariivirga sp.]
MKKQLVGVLGAMILGLASEAAFAADVDAGPAAYDWAGPYIGVQAGYGFGDTSHGTNDFDLDGWAGGVTVGWNYQLENL